MKNLTIGPNYFRNERRVYSDWKVAVFTEILQNALDSRGCTRIDIDIIEKENSVTIIAKDDGSGMSRETLENVFLVVGESSKSNSNGETIGGYGIARNLIAFGMEGYTIKSFDYICSGRGASYEILESKNFVRGCIFEVEAEKADWESKLRKVLDYSSIYQDVYINGVKFKNSLHRGKLVRQLSYADVYVNKSAESGLYVRAKGLLMFNKYTEVNARILVEIHPEKARDVLTSNRNELKYEQSQELQKFLNELASESLSALKDKTRHFKKFVNKNACFKSKPKAPLKLTESGGLIKNDTVTKEVFSIGELIGEKALELAIINSGANPIDREYLPVYQTDPILQSMLVLCESNDVKTVNLIKQFYMPENWTLRTATRYQTIRIWHAICEIVMNTLSEMRNEEFGWAVGWCFTDDSEGESTEAMHLLDDSIHYLLLNPVDKSLKLKYSVTSVDHIFSLIILACHEAAHCVQSGGGSSYHDERFASIFTKLTQKVMHRRKEIFEAIKRAKE